MKKIPFSNHVQMLNWSVLILIVFILNIQSTVQLGLDFLSPESLGEAVRLAEEIRGLPNDHEAKLQILEVCETKFFSILPLVSPGLLC